MKLFLFDFTLQFNSIEIICPCNVLFQNVKCTASDINEEVNTTRFILAYYLLWYQLDFLISHLYNLKTWICLFNSWWFFCLFVYYEGKILRFANEHVKLTFLKFCIAYVERLFVFVRDF